MASASPFALVPAEVSDALAIAKIFAVSWTSPFTRLQFGEVNPDTLATTMASQIASLIENSPNTLFMVMRSASQEIAAVAHWTLPTTVGESRENESAEEKRERELCKDEVYLQELPDGCNKALVYEFMLSLRILRNETLLSRPYFLLDNIATDPAHRGKGLASRLIEWVFPHADKMQNGKGVVVYLETSSESPAEKLYKRLGFEEKGKAVINNLERFGGEGEHVHVAFTREPRKAVT
ncbi:unnamed protein product [Periconia digitata]|uniref:N-acetyltransferase domain-containing protein n=1 Tax=Periconia digitata TaxID=1303443 RepID=A0A9W4U942_9PLEO|nr:unnamed protein product [Periconia digitata]